MPECMPMPPAQPAINETARIMTKAFMETSKENAWVFLPYCFFHYKNWTTEKTPFLARDSMKLMWLNKELWIVCAFPTLQRLGIHCGICKQFLGKTVLRWLYLRLVQPRGDRKVIFHVFKMQPSLLSPRAPFLALALLLPYAAVHAEQSQIFNFIESKPLKEVWLNPGMYSYHFQRDKNLNDSNRGFGIEYRFSTVASATAGRFYNSDRHYSNYAGVYYQPVALGPVRLGVVAGGFNGYPKMRDGGWFLAAIPVASVEYKSFGLNIAIVPTYKDRLYGAISLQPKIKVFE